MWLHEGRTAAAPGDREIRAAVDRAVAYLRPNLTTPDSGRRSLAVLALLKSGVSPDDPQVSAALKTMAARFDNGEKFIPAAHHNYDAGVTLMALATADPQKYRPQIEAIARYLIDNQGPEGDWDYPNKNHVTGDTSITQYAILGLWDAARAGVRVPARVWDKAASWHISRQLVDGSFAYHPNAKPVAGDSSGTHTMTVAGTASLHVARMHLYPNAKDLFETDLPNKGARKRGLQLPSALIPALRDEDVPADEESSDAEYVPVVRLSAIEASIRRGRKWLTDRFTIAPKHQWQVYYLYGIERLATLAGLREIANHDWYTEGAQWLVLAQDTSGRWNDQCGEMAATSLGVMFLVKATQKMLGRRSDPRFGGGLLVGGRGLPDNLESVQVDQGTLQVRKLKGPVDELLSELEKSQSRNIESAQQAIVDTVAVANPEALIGQKDRLLKLVGDRRVEVRRTAYWALGRTNDLRVVPVLIEGLRDTDPACIIEARNALQFISKRLSDDMPPDEATEAQRSAAIVHWKKWYLSVRPYDERDDLLDPGRTN
ncbi:MAG: HEAT repeat domain-containing protein [Planctomycetaceae bacterium]